MPLTVVTINRTIHSFPGPATSSHRIRKFTMVLVHPTKGCFADYWQSMSFARCFPRYYIAFATAAIATFTLCRRPTSSYESIYIRSPSLKDIDAPILHFGETVKQAGATRQYKFPLPELSSSASSSTTPIYTPGSVEKMVLGKATELGYDKKDPNGDDGCNIWLNEHSDLYPDEVHKNLMMYREELQTYNRLMEDFKGTSVPDIRTLLTSDEDREQACRQLELHPLGLQGIFGGSQQLSHTASVGWIEPILPPQRYPELCFNSTRANKISMSYLVHDFANMCRKLKPTSRIILIDMGASLSFHDRDTKSPPIYLMETYKKFGMPFDHIYAFEITPTPPEKVIQKVPDHLLAAYHWFNVGVDFDIKSKSNPLKLLLENFTPDDLVVVKLDIDTPQIEMPLARQILLNDELHPLIDHFYFEHHVFLKQLASSWRDTMIGSIKDSLELFEAIREKGVAAHFWP